MEQNLYCPISGDLLNDPITVPCCGKAFSRLHLLTWFNSSNPTCPSCRGDLSSFDAVGAAKNVVLASLVEDYTKEQEKEQVKPKQKWSASFTPFSEDYGELHLTLENSTFLVNPSLFIAVIDRSGSMCCPQGRNTVIPWEQVKTALIHIMGLTESNNMVKTEIVSYGSTAEIVDLSGTSEQVRNKIQGLYHGDGTNFIASFEEIRVLLNKYVNSGFSSVNIAFLTDGQAGNTAEVLNTTFQGIIKDAWSSRTKVPLTIHAIGFGEGCDKNLLESLRKNGTTEGTFRYADPNDDVDTLCHKLTGLFDLASRNSSIKLDISLDSCYFKNGTQKANIMFPINQNRFGSYKCWARNPGTLGHLNVEGQTQIDIETRAVDPELMDKWISYLIDSLASDVLELSKKNRDTYTAFELHCALCQTKITALSKQASEIARERLEFISAQVDAISEGRSIDIGRLGDLRFASQFGELIKSEKKAPESKPADYTPVPRPQKVIEWVERNIRYSMNNAGAGRNPLQEAIILNHCFKNGEVVRKLLSAATIDDVSFKDNNGNNALMLASYCGEFDVVDELLTKFPNIPINQENNDKETALTLAIKKQGYYKTLRNLTKKGAIIPKGRATGLQEFAVAAGYSVTADIIGGLGDSGTEIGMGMKPNYIKFLYEKNKETQEFNVQNYLEVCLAKCQIDSGMVPIVKELVKKHGARPDLNMLIDYCIPPKPDDPETDKYIKLAKLVLGVKPELINEIDPETGEGPLFKAAEKGSLPHVKLFIAQGAKIDTRTKIGNTPLWIAAAKRYPCIIEELLNSGADPNAVNLKGNPPLYNICQRGPKKIAETLISYGATVDHINQNGDTLVLLACRNGQPEILELFLDYIKPEFVNYKAHIDGFNAIFASVEANRPECIKILHKYGVNLEGLTDSDNQILPGGTPLHLAAHYGCCAAANTLISLGANVDSRDINGRTPLHIAVMQGQISVIKVLRDAKANLSVVDKLNNTPVAYARTRNDIRKVLVNPIVEVLIKLARTEIDDTQEAVLRENSEIPCCLSHKTVVNVTNEFGNTPLTEAVIYSNYRMAKVLVDLGADPNIKNKHGMDSSIWAFWAGNFRIKGLSLGDVNLDVIRALDKAKNSDRLTMFLGRPPKVQVIATESGIIKRMHQTLPLESGEPVGKGALIVPSPDANLIDGLLWNAKIFTIGKMATEEHLSPRDVMLLNLYTSSPFVHQAILEKNTEAKNFTQGLLKALNELPPFAFECYFSRQWINRQEFAIGELVSFDGLLSCSTLWRVAIDQLPEKKGTTFIVKTQKARYLADYSSFPVDSEVILLPESKYRITAWYRFDPICLGQANIRQHTFGVKEEDKSANGIQGYLESDKGLIIELEEV